MKRFARCNFPRGLSSKLGMSTRQLMKKLNLEKCRGLQIRRDVTQALVFYISTTHIRATILTAYLISSWQKFCIILRISSGSRMPAAFVMLSHPSTITFATPSEKWSFLMIVLRDHGQFSRSKPTPLPGGHWELQRFSSLHSYYLILCGEVMSMHCCEEMIRFLLLIVLGISVA